MQSYIMTIIGATLLGAMAQIISPEKWRDYVRIVTGIVILICIVTPIFSLVHTDMFSRIEGSIEMNGEGRDIQSQIVMRELKKNIDKDIEQRLNKEFKMNVRADCSLKMNADNELEGVSEIHIYGAKLTGAARLRLCEVYGLGAEGVHDE